MKERILITGATGFLGQALVKKLLKQQFEIIALVRASSNTSLLKKLSRDIIFVKRTDDSIQNIFRETKPKYVIHCAVSYGRREENSVVFKTNLDLFVALLDASIKNNVTHFLNTDTFSGKTSNYNYLKAYHLSKRQAIEWADILLENTDMKFSNLRLEHLYGPFDNEDKFVPFIIKSLKNNIKELDLTSGTQQRDFIHIDDVVNAYLSVLRHQKSKSCEYEVGTGVSTSIKDFVSTCKSIMCGCQTELNFGKLPTRIGEFKQSKANLKNLHGLKWYPQISLEQGLSKIINLTNSYDLE